jgi:hypothetical protein
VSGAGVFPVPEHSGANAWRDPVGTGTYFDRTFLKESPRINEILRLFPASGCAFADPLTP